MSTKVIDYTLDNLTPANPDASCPATVTGCVVVPGPGATTLGTYASALDLSGGGELVATLPVAQLDTRKFAVRLVFKIDTPVAVAQTLAASDAIPLELSLVPGSGTSDFHLVATVTTSSYGSGEATTRYLTDLHLGVWYTADLVYDTDTLAAFVDGTISSVHAFPDGTLSAGTGDTLFIGRSSGGTGQFDGALAALELHADIPIDLESQLDEFRSHPQWFLTYKQEEIKYTLAFGAPTNEFYFDFPSGAWIQPFAGGILMYHDANGQAFEMHGAILQTYWTLPIRAAAGYLVSDELAGAQAGSRKSLFSGGGIYWSSGTGAIPVLGQIWVDYEGMGESGAIGLPTGAAVSISGGQQQVFQRAQMYWRSGSAKAFMVTGAILAKFLATGGTGAWGFPVSNENDVMSASTAIGKLSEFQNCTIYWSGSTGAAIVYGDIRAKYRNVGGPGGRLGFPTSDESDVPGAAAPARINSFQHGSIVWFGSTSETYVCEAFDIVLGTVDTVESEGWLRGQNDLYMWATIEDDGFVLHHERIPGSGDHGGNIYTIDRRFDLGPAGIIPNDIHRDITFSLDVWDSDWPDDDDHLGDLHAELNAANAWGLRGNPTGLQNSGHFSLINNISWAVAPHVNEAALAPAKKWWGVQNAGTDPLTYEQYATAFRDVDSSPEWWDITDWLEKLFYELVVKHVAKGGNCFGMSLESIYSKKDRALLTEPIDRFTSWGDSTVVNEFNVKHQYQVGASAIWWFVGEFLSGQTHDPVSVFRASRAAFEAGCDPVICIAQHYDFSGAPHCILPVGWDDTVTPWEIQIRDPNYPTMSDSDAPRTLYVDPVANTFHYDGGNVYDGGAWSGGRFHYIPFDLVNERPRTPIYDAIMLLLSGVILIVGSDSQTSGLTDENGVDLDAFGPDAVGRLQAGRSLSNKFVSVKGFFEGQDVVRGKYDFERDCPPERTGPKPKEPDHDRPTRPRPHGAIPGELHMRSAPKRYSRVVPPNKRSGDDWTRLTLKEYLCQVAPAHVRELFDKQTDFVAQNQLRLMMHLTDSATVREIIAASGTIAPPVDYPAISQNFIHHTRVVRGGRFEYALKQGLSQMVVTAEAGAGEVHTVKVKDLGSHNNVVTLTGYRDKVFSLQVHNKLGVGRDYLRMEIDDIPMTAGGDLQLNVKPGIGGIELVSAGQVIQSTVTFEYLQHGTRLSSRFALNGQDGLRLVPSTFITDNQLKVSRITDLFGQSLSSDIVQAMP
jgi:LGFP repeat/Concanavalin A-like lectin/glucanases superfamily